MHRLLVCMLATVIAIPALAQERATPRLGPVSPPTAQPPTPVQKPTVEADISTRSLEVTTGFTGHEIIVFGAVDNSQAPQEHGGYYDVVVVVEGTPFPVVVRKKSDVAGVWINTSSVTFASVPSYYAIASTRPIEEIAGPPVLERHAIGFQHIKMTPAAGARGTFKDYELAAYRAAVIRLKKAQNLYVIQPKDGVTFTGRSLFRSTIALPANVPVGPLVARTYLFRNGEVISAHIARVTLQRAGIERLVHNFAFVHSMSYGLIAVLLAVVSGLLASAYFRRQPA
ncbi:MAG TPA: TIGR02186 family protein [Hyphomicrobium sp.]